jgi:hypothetical protein
MQKEFSESFLEADQQRRETFLHDLLRISVIAIFLKKWNMAKHPNPEKISRTLN